jgi:high-affinity Fe2+/Pb2+ permease
MIKGELTGGLAVATTSAAVLVFAAMAVAREGFETVMILLAANAQSSSPIEVAAAATLGFGAATALALVVHRAGRRLDLAKFFKYTGLALIAFAVYSLAMGVHEFIELAAPSEAIEIGAGLGIPIVYAFVMLRWFLRPAPEAAPRASAVEPTSSQRIAAGVAARSGSVAAAGTVAERTAAGRTPEPVA